MFFMQQLGGAVFLAVGQNIFSSQLVDSLPGMAGLDAEAIINTGATALRKTVPSSELGTVINAYSFALTRVFILAAALSACMILGAVAVEWKSIKGNKGDASGNATVEKSVILFFAYVPFTDTSCSNCEHLRPKSNTPSLKTFGKDILRTGQKRLQCRTTKRRILHAALSFQQRQ